MHKTPTHVGVFVWHTLSALLDDVLDSRQDEAMDAHSLLVRDPPQLIVDGLGKANRAGDGLFFRWGRLGAGRADSERRVD